MEKGKLFPGEEELARILRDIGCRAELFLDEGRWIHPVATYGERGNFGQILWQPGHGKGKAFYDLGHFVLLSPAGQRAVNTKVCFLCVFNADALCCSLWLNLLLGELLLRLHLHHQLRLLPNRLSPRPLLLYPKHVKPTQLCQCVPLIKRTSQSLSQLVFR